MCYMCRKKDVNLHTTCILHSASAKYTTKSARTKRKHLHSTATHHHPLSIKLCRYLLMHKQVT